MKRLRLYAQSKLSEKKALSASLTEAESKSRHLESEAREAVNKAVHAEAERDAACHEVAVARLEIEAAGSTREQMESELARVQGALTSAEDIRRKMKTELDVTQKALAVSGGDCRTTEEESRRLTDERVSLLEELRASKDEFYAFRAEVAKEKKALEVEYDVGFEVIFNYGYDCCAFAHNICGSKPKIPNEMPGTSEPLTLEFFVNPRCPPVAVPIATVVAPKEGISEEVEHSSVARAEVGDNPNSLSRVAGEREEPGI